LESASEPTDVGINLANTRIGADMGSDRFIAVAPPYAVGLDDDTVELTFSSPNQATLLVPPDEKATAIYSKAPNNAPAALTGHTITATPSGKDQVPSIIIFTNNTFSGSIGGGAYTYAPYTPKMALVQFNVTSGSEAGETTYYLLEFASTGEGPYVFSKRDPATPGGWDFVKGTFTITTTK
jgi:hypothetical protein